MTMHLSLMIHQSVEHFGIQLRIMFLNWQTKMIIVISNLLLMAVE
jgi:hypothetical protein